MFADFIPTQPFNGWKFLITQMLSKLKFFFQIFIFISTLTSTQILEFTNTVDLVKLKNMAPQFLHISEVKPVHLNDNTESYS